MEAWRRMGLVLCVVALAGCATTQSSVHRSLSESPDRPLPKKMLLLPAEIRVHEVSTGGVVEKVDRWSDLASANATRYIKSLANSGLFKVVESPALSPEEKLELDQHVALYEVVAGSAYLAGASQFGPWRERAKNFDYTLGAGLKPLADHTGIDAAMIVIGSAFFW